MTVVNHDAASAGWPLADLAAVLPFTDPPRDRDRASVESLLACFGDVASPVESRAVAASLSSDLRLLGRLACDPDPLVREEVAGNDACDASVLMRVVAAGGMPALRAALSPRLDPQQAADAARSVRGIVKRISAESGPWGPLSRDFVRGNPDAVEVFLGAWSMRFLAELAGDARCFHPRAVSRVVSARLHGLHRPFPAWTPGRGQSMGLPRWHAAHAVAAGLAAGLDGDVPLGSGASGAASSWVERWWVDPSVRPDPGCVQEVRSAVRVAAFAHGEYLESLDVLVDPDLRPLLLPSLVWNPWAAPERVLGWGRQHPDALVGSVQALMRRASSGVDEVDVVRSFDLALEAASGIHPRAISLERLRVTLRARFEASPELVDVARVHGSMAVRRLLSGSQVASLQDAFQVAPARSAVVEYRDPVALVAWVHGELGRPGLETFASLLGEFDGSLGELVDAVRHLG